MPKIDFNTYQTIADVMTTNMPTTIMLYNCVPNEASLLVNGTIRVPQIPAIKCTGMAPTTSSILNLSRIGTDDELPDDKATLKKIEKANYVRVEED